MFGDQNISLPKRKPIHSFVDLRARNKLLRISNVRFGFLDYPIRSDNSGWVAASVLRGGGWIIVAQRAVPNRTWRIVTSDAHGTVWDCKQNLFDFKFTALGISPEHVRVMAITDGYVLESSELLETGITVDT